MKLTFLYLFNKYHAIIRGFGSTQNPHAKHSFSNNEIMWEGWGRGLTQIFSSKSLIMKVKAKIGKTASLYQATSLPVDTIAVHCSGTRDSV